MFHSGQICVVGNSPSEVLLKALADVISTLFSLFCFTKQNVSHLRSVCILNLWLMAKVFIYIYIYIRGGTIHVFVPNRHGTGISDRCMRPYNEYRQFTLNPEGGTRSNATLFDNRQQKNSECHELRTWKQSPLDSDHVLILNASLT